MNPAADNLLLTVLTDDGGLSRADEDVYPRTGDCAAKRRAREDSAGVRQQPGAAGDW